MTFRPYEKIHRLGKEEVVGILEGICIIQEKVDGANTSIWLDNLDSIQCASRNQIIKDGFNGFLDWIFDSPHGASVHRLLKDHPTWRLYGEWLVKHTIQYNQENYKEWYMFDIYESATNEYLPASEVYYLANKYSIMTPTAFADLQCPTLEQLNEYVGRSSLGPVGEGIVIKNEAFINKWGNRCHAKLVHQNFLEDNGLIFNSNHKASDNYNEMYIVNKYLNAARVDKVLNKLQPQIDETLDMKHIPRITNTVYHDLITEEAWEIAKLNKSIDYKALKTLAMKKAKLLFVEHLEKAQK